MYVTSRLAKKIKSRELHSASKTTPIYTFDYDEPVPEGRRHAVRKRKDLIPSEILDIVYKVMIKFDK